MNDVTAVIINFQTSALVERAVTSLRRYYPSLPLLLIDNGSHDDSVDVITRLKSESAEYTEIILNQENIHHGPAMDQGLRLAKTPFVFVLDSDCVVLREGFIEQMVALLQQSPTHYITGKLNHLLNKLGL